MTLMVGDDGKVLLGSTPVADVTAWRFETAMTGKEFASSATNGFRRWIAGARHGRGRFSFRLDDANPAWQGLSEGTQVTLYLHLDDDHCYTIPAIIQTVQVDVSMAGGQPITGQATFATDGAWTEPN